MTIHTNVRDSRLVLMTREARRPSRWWLAWIAVLVIALVVRPLGLTLGNAVLQDPGPSQVGYPYVDGVVALVALVALFLWVRFKEGRPFATVGFRPGREAVRMVAGFGVGGGLITLGVALGLVLGVYGTGQSTHTRTGADAILPLLPLVLLLLFQAAAQEALTRGYLLQMSVRRLPVWVAIIATSALVTVLGSFHPVTMINAFLYAIFASLVVLQQGSLWAVIGIQAGWSFFQLNVFGLPVGGVPDANALWSIGPVPDGSALLGGGGFGLDAGLLGTAVLAAATVLAYLRLRRTTRVTTAPAPTPVTPEPAPRKEPSHAAH